MARLPNPADLLVVDGPVETEQVLKAVFEPQGHAVQRVRTGEINSRGDVSRIRIVHETPRVVITADGERAMILPEPYQYADLVSIVERMIA